MVQNNNNLPAPILAVDSDKESYEDTTGFTQIPNTILSKLFEKLSSSPAQLRLMIILIGTKPGFGLSKTWLMERAQVCRTNLYRTLNALIDNGYLSRDEERNLLIINYKKLME